MTSPMQRANTWSQLVIGAAIEVHRIKGPGLIEEIYSKCLGRECELRNIPLGLLINFHEIVLRNGIYRMVLKDGDSSWERVRIYSQKIAKITKAILSMKGPTPGANSSQAKRPKYIRSTDRG